MGCRFHGGWNDQVAIPGLYSCLPGLEIIEKVGPRAIAEESRRRTQWMVESALERGWGLMSLSEADRRGGSVMVGVDDPEGLEEQLAKRGVLVDWRPGVLRMSPHFFNTDEEVQEALKILAALIG